MMLIVAMTRGEGYNDVVEILSCGRCFCMLGAIIGDIVGSVYEFDNIKTKRFSAFSGGLPVYGRYRHDHSSQKCAADI